MPIHMRMRKLRGPHMKKSMPFEPFRTHTQAVNLGDLEARFDDGAEVTLERAREGRPRHAQGHPGEDPRQGRDHQAAHRPRPRLQRQGPRGASRPPAGPASSSSPSRRSRITAWSPRSSAPSRVPEIRKKLALHGGAAGALPARRRTSRCRASTSRPSTAVQEQFGGGGILNLLNTFSGGGLSRIAIFALGIMPYITASIILQLLTVVVPSLEKLQKEGEVGQAADHAVHALPHRRPRLRAVDRLRLPVPLASQPAAGQAIIDNFTRRHGLHDRLVLTAGCVLLMWMGELITQRGIGNGISLMIFASIVAGLPERHPGLVDEPRPGLQGHDAVPRARA